MYFCCSLCRPDFAAREAAPGSKWQWPNRDTKWRHLKDDRDAAARELVAFVFVQESANLQLPPYVAGMPDPNWILQLKGAKEWDGIIALYKDKLAILTAMFPMLQTHPSPSTSQAQLILEHQLPLRQAPKSWCAWMSCNCAGGAKIWEGDYLRMQTKSTRHISRF